MHITQEEIVDRQTVLQVELEDADTAPYVDIAIRKVRPNVAHPGFRRGRAPRHIILQRYGRSALLGEVLDTMLPELADKAVEIQEIETGGTPTVELVSSDPLTLSVTVPLPPEVTLGDYKSIRIQFEPAEVTDEDIEQRLQGLRASVSSLEPVDRAVQLGDVATITAAGAVNGSSVMDEADIPYPVVEDAERPFPGFAQELVGMEIGTPKDFTLAIPEDFDNTTIAGETVHISVTVSEVKERIMPDLDDEFAKTIGEGYDSLDVLREQVTTELQAEADRAAEEEIRGAAVKSLLDGASTQVAPIVVESQIDFMFDQQAQMLAQYNIRIEDYMMANGVDLDSMREELREEAEHRVKVQVTLNEFSEAEGIQVTDEDVEEERLQAVVDRMKQAGNPELNIDDIRNQLRQSLHFEKTMEHLSAIAKGEVYDSPTADAPDASAEPPEQVAPDSNGNDESKNA